MTRNPVLREDTFTNQSAGPFVGGGLPGSAGADTMTVRGVINKGAILMVLVAATFTWSWNAMLGSNSGATMPLLMGAGVLGFVLSLVISFKPRMAPFLAPVFALTQGAVLGVISAAYEYEAAFGNNVPSGYDGIVFQAALGTCGVFAAMLTLYRTRLVRVTQRMRAVVGVAMLGIVFTYLASFALSFFGTTVPLIHENGIVGIGFSLLVIVVASFMLLVDFDMIERGVATGAPRYMEWYGAFALLVTLVWIYLEMLRLLSKLRGR